MAVNVLDLEAMKAFYTRYLGAKAHLPHYQNPKTGLETCFLSFEDGSRLELMHWPETVKRVGGKHSLGWVHLAFSLGNRDAVDLMTARLREDGWTVLSGPRVTGDGYYESLFEDPEGNLLEITA